MKGIKIIGNGAYLPLNKITNEEIEKNFKMQAGYIEKRTGIVSRYYKEKNENINDIAYKAAKASIKNAKIQLNEINLIIVATTSTNMLMPGISNSIQAKLGIENCICLDILAGCAGYINAFDIARMYIITGKVRYAMIIGVEVLSDYLDETNADTKIVLSDGAGSTIIGIADKDKIYSSNIQSNGKDGEILTCKTNERIKMEGKAVYKYAVTEATKNVEELLKQAKLNIKDIKYIVPHQSNIKIIKSIASRLEIDMKKMYTNIESVGNTFCASIPIALTQMYKEKLLCPGDKAIFVGYGGGLNTASILLEI